MAGTFHITADGRLDVVPLFGDVDETPITIESTNTCPSCGEKKTTTFDVQKWASEYILRECHALCDKCRKVEEQKEIRSYKESMIAKRMDAATIPPEFLTWDPTIGNQQLARSIRNERNKSLYIVGANSKGKTRAAAYNLYVELKAGFNCKYWRFSDLAASYARVCKSESENSSYWLKKQLEYDIIVIDDICKRRITDTAGEMLYDILDIVYGGESTCRLWITSNRDLQGMANEFASADVGDAVASRIDRMADETDGRLKIIQA